MKLYYNYYGEEIKEIEIKKDPISGKEIISYKNDIKNDKPKEKEIISIKDSKTGKEKLIDKNTGNELTNIEKKVDEKTGKTILINKETGEKIKGINTKIDPITGEEIFIKE